MPATAGMTRRAMQFGLLPSPTGDSRSVFHKSGMREISKIEGGQVIGG